MKETCKSCGEVLPQQRKNKWRCDECADELIHGIIPPASPLFPAAMPATMDDISPWQENVIRELEDCGVSDE